MMSIDGFEVPVGTICLDFTNTWGTRSDAASDRLRSFSDLVEWAVQIGLLADDQASRLNEQSRREPEHAAAILRRALSLRDAIFSCCVRMAGRHDLLDEDIEVLNRELATALPRLQLRRAEEGCRWFWLVPDGALDCVLWPVVHSAAELLSGDTAGRVRQCASESCSWLFVDSSRNRSRRWCDMAGCGNRAKARRYYARHRD